MVNSDELEKQFLNAANQIQESNLKLENDVMLKLYGYYKQGKMGDCNIECPAFWKVKEKAKWEAWEQHRGMKKTHSMKKYIKLVESILNN